MCKSDRIAANQAPVALCIVTHAPITGIPLPFLSYGGSFTMVNFISTG